MTERVYPKGIITFAKNDKAPDFVLGDIIINIDEFNDWANGEGSSHITEYNGKRQIRFNTTKGRENKGIQFSVKPKTEQ